MGAIGLRAFYSGGCVMSFDPVRAVYLDALAVGMKARCNGLSQGDVDAMVTRAEEAMPSDDLMFRSITAFAVQFEECRFDPERLAEIGETLTNAVRRLSQPDPVDAGRADIYG